MKIKFIFFILLLLSSACYGQDGSLDNSFNFNGMKVTNISGVNDDRAYGIVVQTDGKIVLAGTSGYSSNNDITLVRYNPTGTLDNSFGGTGIVKTSVGNKLDAAYAIALQVDGKIVVAGQSPNSSNTDIAVLRYDTNGSLDGTFDGDGIVTTDINASLEIALGLAIQADGKIVVVGYRNAGIVNTILIVRYNSDGSLDGTFDSDGIVTTTILGIDDMAKAVTIQADGKILAAGYSKVANTNSDFALLRYNTDGSLDNTFDSDGIATTDFNNGSYEVGNAIVLQPDGKIVVAGTTGVGNSKNFALARYNNDGSLDNTFDTDGKLTTSIGGGGASDCHGLAIQADNKLLAAGGGFGALDMNFGVVRYNTDGALDNSFSGDGIVKSPIGSNNNECYAVAIQPDGRVVAAGYSQSGTVTPNFTGDDFAVARYKANPVFVGLNSTMEIENEMAVFPNPFTLETTISTKGIQGEFTLYFYNAQGQKIKEMNYLSGQNVILSRGNLDCGLYFVQLLQFGKTLASQRIVIYDLH